jgi:hypothetical protein
MFFRWLELGSFSCSLEVINDSPKRRVYAFYLIADKRWFTTLKVPET